MSMAAHGLHACVSGEVVAPQSVWDWSCRGRTTAHYLFALLPVHADLRAVANIVRVPLSLE